MQDIYRVCGNRLNNYTESDGWPTESLPAFDMQAKMQRRKRFFAPTYFMKFHGSSFLI